MPETAATPADIELARAALLEITPENTIGEPAGSADEGDGITSVYFTTTMGGYPGWRWTVSIAHVEGSDPSVLEAELTPGDDALLSPPWVPWADRLAEYKAQQAESDATDDDADTDDDDDFDDDDDDELLDGSDLDGVDIDSLEDAEGSAPEAQVEQADEAEPDPDDGGDEQPKAAVTRQRRAQKKNDG